MILETGLESFQDLIGIVDVRFGDVDLLKPPRQRPIFVEDATIFAVGGGTHAADFAGGQQRLQQVRGIHHAT